MDARTNGAYKRIMAFGGLEYNRDWRPVPAGCEDEARRNPYLETREAEIAEPVAEPAPAPAPAPVPAPPQPRKSTPTRKAVAKPGRPATRR